MRMIDAVGSGSPTDQVRAEYVSHYNQERPHRRRANRQHLDQPAASTMTEDQVDCITGKLTHALSVVARAD